MKNHRIIKYLLRSGTEIAIMLLVVSLFFGLLTTLLFSIFPSGISLTQILERRNGLDGSRQGGAAGSGAGLDMAGKEAFDQAAAVLSAMGNDVRSKGAASIAWGPAREGMRLRDHDAIQTFSDSSAQINFDSRNYLTMGSNSLVIIKSLQRERTSNEQRSAIVMVDGELHARIGGSGPNQMQLNIATPTALVRMLPGTSGRKSDFKININSDKSSTIVVLQGQAEVSAQGKTVRVGENSGVTVKEGEAPKAAASLPSPPALLSPADRSVIRYRDLPQRVNLKWSAGKSGNNYRVQVAKDQAFKELVVDKRLDETGLVHGNLKKGGYFWRVSRIAGGLEGKMSKARSFEIAQNLSSPSLSVRFPSGAVLDDHCTIAGSTDAGNKVFVKGQAVSTDERGAFSCQVPVKPGMTLVTVEAVDASGNVTYRSQYIQGRFEP